MGEMPEDKETLLMLLKSGGGGFGLDAIRAKLDLITATELIRNLSQLSEDISHFRRGLSEKLDALNNELAESRKELHEGSEAATEQTSNLVKWTRVLVIVTAAYVALTLGLFGTSWQQSQTAQKAMQLQIDPEIKLEVQNGNAGYEAVIANEGLHWLVKVTVAAEVVIYAPSPFNRIVTKLKPNPRVPSSPDFRWWQVGDLEPATVLTRPINDLAEGALNVLKVKIDPKSIEQIMGAKKEAIPNFHALLHLQMSVHREVDLKQFKITKTVAIERDAQTGRPMILEAEVLTFVEPVLEQILQKLGKENL